jgi:hypothetical protein
MRPKKTTIYFQKTTIPDITIFNILIININ